MPEEKIKKVMINIPEGLHMAFKVHCVITKKTMQKVLLDYVKHVVEKGEDE